MRAHLDAIMAMLAPSGRQVYLGEVQGAPVFPYYLLWSTTGRLVADAVDGAQSTINDLIGVTSVGKTFESALELSRTARVLLLSKAPTVPGYDPKPLRLHDAQRVQLDRDVTIPDTNLHPFFGVDLLRLISEPA